MYFKFQISNVLRPLQTLQSGQMQLQWGIADETSHSGAGNCSSGQCYQVPSLGWTVMRSLLNNLSKPLNLSWSWPTVILPIYPQNIFWTSDVQARKGQSETSLSLMEKTPVIYSFIASHAQDFAATILKNNKHLGDVCWVLTHSRAGVWKQHGQVVHAITQRAKQMEVSRRKIQSWSAQTQIRVSLLLSQPGRNFWRLVGKHLENNGFASLMVLF